METLTIKQSKDETRELVKYAFEQTSGIKSYHDDGETITGKTGFRLGSYGESVTVAFRNTGSKPTDVVITSDRAVNFNITANPQRYESRFVTELITLSDRDIDRIDIETTNESQSHAKHSNGHLIFIYIMAIVCAVVIVWLINFLLLL